MTFHANKKSEYQYNFHAETLHLKVKKLISKVNILEKEIRKDYEDDRPEYNWVWGFFCFCQNFALYCLGKEWAIVLACGPHRDHGN